MAAALFNNMGPGIHVLKICSGWEVGLLGDSKHSHFSGCAFQFLHVLYSGNCIN